MSDGSNKTAIGIQALVLIAGFAAAAWLTGFVEQKRPVMPADYLDSDLTVRGSNLKGFTLGMDGLIADWYYVGALHYVGDKILASRSETINIDDLRDLNLKLLYPLLDNATDLDPHFIDAYSYGAIVLPAVDPQQAVAIAEKGVANNPNEWRLYRPLGYIYWKLGEYEKASAVYERGSEIDGAPPFLRFMAAAMKTKGGSRETAREIYREMLASATEESVRITAERRLAQLDSLDDLDAINAALTEFQRENGRCPANFAEILPRLAAVKLPENRQLMIDRSRNIIDPSGVPYLLDQQQCTASIDRSHSGIVQQ
jgi:tetratricopeptide (TPR) repeat protein